jgi:hypothetical protein
VGYRRSPRWDLASWEWDVHVGRGRKESERRRPRPLRARFYNIQVVGKYYDPVNQREKGLRENATADADNLQRRTNFKIN